MDLLEAAEAAESQSRHALLVILLNYLNRTDEVLIMEAVESSGKSTQFSQTTRRQI
jgi:hypothetical protein